jgi:hypothetical protein
MKTRRQARAWVLEQTINSLRTHAQRTGSLPGNTLPQRKRVSAEMLALAAQLERRLAKLTTGGKSDAC